MKNILRKTIYSYDFLLFIFVKIKSLFYKYKSQSNEASIIESLCEKYNINKNYLEIGFSPWEFNCSSLAKANKGVIIDANKTNTKIGKWLLKKAKIICEFIDLDNIDKLIKDINFPINIISLDIDGNDYYIMERLFKLNSSMIVCEYNPAFHLRPITIPYKKDFDRTKEHKEWVYYGCSLKAWEIIMKKNDFSLVSISSSGVNAFFVKNNLIKNKNEILNPEKDFVDYDWPDNKTHEDIWNKMNYKNFITIKN